MDLERYIEVARALVLEMLEGDHRALPGACLYHAVAIHKITGADIHAGSYSWQFTNVDTGTNPTHFSCIFDARAQKIAKLILKDPEALKGLSHFPEMHVWNVLNGKILDISTLHLPDFAYRLGRFKFEPSLMPPPYHQGAWTGPKSQWKYESHPLAIELAAAAARNTLQKFSYLTG